MASQDQTDRRRYRRVQAPILVRPVGPLAHLAARTVADISLGGLRTYADEAIPAGRRLELELVFADGTTVTVLAEVAWSEPLGEGAPAAHEMGLVLVGVSPEATALIEAVLLSN
jgi:hypothetical protein